MAIELYTDINYKGIRRTFDWKRNARYQVNGFRASSAIVGPGEIWNLYPSNNVRGKPLKLSPGLYPDLTSEPFIKAIIPSNELNRKLPYIELDSINAGSKPRPVWFARVLDLIGHFIGQR